jgi:hypothetical protein
MIDVLDADLVDRDLAGIGAALHVFDGENTGLGSNGRFHLKAWVDKARTVCGLS